MQILTDFNKPYIIDSLTAPVVVKYNWIFHGPTTDFMLQQIHYLEETTGAAVKVRINNTDFWIPALWNILVTDKETYQIDTVGIQSCASIKHVAFAFSPDESKLRTLDISIVDYCDKMSIVHPMINKSTALVHPVGPSVGYGKQVQLAVVIGPHDLAKHLTNKVVGDVLEW